MWWPGLLMNRDEMSNFHRGPSYQIYVHWGKRFQRRRFFRNQPIAGGGHVCYNYWQPYIYIAFTMGWHKVTMFDM